jgi:cytidylate kinase
MAFSVIAISRAAGAGGENLGQTLADEFGMRYVDSEIIDRAAERSGATRDDVADSEKRKGLLAKMLDNLARSGAVAYDMGGAVAYAENLGPDYPHVIVDVIREVAAEGNCVLVAHGASHALAGREDVLRILVTASPATRARRIEREHHGPGRARQSVEESDKARADFLKRFYGVNHEEPTQYDLVVNTDHLSVEKAAAAIREIVKE